MIDKLFFKILYVAINLVVILGAVCHAEDIDLGVPPAKTQENLIPDHEIKYKETLSPDWKVNWDLARSLYRDKKYPEALVQYEILFTQKENIDEARWEYVTILMHLGRWENAKGELEKLLATEPESISYRLAMARVNLEIGNLDGAVALYSQLHGQRVSEAERVIVLKGLVKAYELNGQKAEAAVLLQQLVLLEPQDPVLQLKQAIIEMELGNLIRSKEICTKLELSRPRDVAVLTLQAVLENRLNNKDLASIYWQKIIALEPDNAEAHRQMYTYYFERGNWEMSFSHLEQLIKMTPNNVSLLVEAADLNLRMDRIDRAMEYYEYGLAVDPLNKDIIEGKNRAQKILAKDLLALVENEGSKKLWQDLVKVTPDTAGVYHEMAELLREQGKVDELIEVLTLLNKQAPDDQQTYEELASLLEQQGRLDELSALQANSSALGKSERD